MAIIIRNFVLLFICGWTTYTDIKRMEIDHTPLLIGCLFIIPFTLLGYNDISISTSLISAGIMFIIFFILALFGMGGGDLKFMTMIGLFLGFGRSLTIAGIMCITASIFGVLYILIRFSMSLSNKSLRNLLISLTGINGISVLILIS